MKELRFNGDTSEWSIPVDELSSDLKRMLQIQYREFIDALGDVGENRVFVSPAVIAMLERLFIAVDPAV